MIDMVWIFSILCHKKNQQNSTNPVGNCVDFSLTFISITKFLLYIEEFLSDLNTMLSYPKWVQMHGPTLAEVILHDSRLGEKNTEKKGVDEHGGANAITDVKKIVHVHIISYNHRCLRGHV